jgi:serine/threonine-protein kinase RsbW
MGKSTHAKPESASFVIANTREDIERAETFLMDALGRHRYPEAARFAVRLSLEEALVNAFKHGHRELPPESTVNLALLIDTKRIQIDVVDQGPGFNPADVPDPTLDENLDKPSGRGLLLMRAYMTSLEHIGRGNHLRMVFHRSAQIA